MKVPMLCRLNLVLLDTGEMYERTISSSSQGFPLIDRRYSLAT